MKRLARPVAYTVLSVAALVAFVRAKEWSVDPFDVNDPAGWLDRVDPVDALVEVARGLGLALAAYVAVVSATALLADASGMLRMPRLARGLRQVATVVAVPALRRRLLEVTTAVTITASAVHASPALAGGPTPVVASAVVDTTANDVLAPVPIRAEFEGFGAVPVSAAPTADPAGEATYVVQPGDTLWQIVERHYGHADANLAHQVASASHIDDPNLIRPGWTITLPAATPTPPRVVEGEATWGAVTVVAGDDLWGIIERHYGEANSDLVWMVLGANPEIDNPGLILPGQVITLPPVRAPEQDVGDPVPEVDPPAPPIPEATPPTSVAEQVPSPSVPSSVPPTTRVDASPASAPTTAAPEPTAVAPTDVVVDATVQTTRPTDTPLSTTAPISAEQAIDEDREEHPSVAAIVGWTGGAGLAAALIGLATRRRRRQPARRRHGVRSPRAVQLGIALHETENLPLVDFAANALRAAATRIRPRPGEPTPVPRMMRLAGDSVELVWDAPNSDVIDPWVTTDGGWSWNIDRGAAVDVSDGPAPCPGLVTIGTQEGADVLLNLESCGTIAITGDQDAVEALARSIATEFAASAFADSPTVLTVGLPSLPGEPEHCRRADISEAIAWLRDRVDSSGALLAHRRLTSLFALRARSKPHDAYEPVVIVVDPAAAGGGDLARLIELANGDLGAVVLLLGEHPSVTWRLECTGYDVTVQPLDLTLDAAALPESIDDLIGEYVPGREHEVDDFDEFDGREAVPPELVLADQLGAVAMREQPAPTSCQSDAGAAGDADEWDVELKVLGQVRCIGAQETLVWQELELAVLMAFNRGGLSSDTIIEWVWPKGCAHKTFINAMTDLRRKLGADRDGELLLPLGRSQNYVYSVSARVVTDWERFVALARKADSLPDNDALEVLDQALTLVEGPPFQAPKGYSWAYSDGTAALIVETIKAVAHRSIDLHARRGAMFDAAARAGAALSAIGVPLSGDSIG